MRKLFVLIYFVSLAIGAFSQTDTTSIFHIADSLNNLGDKFYDEKKYTEALDLYNQAAEITKSINEGRNEHYATALYNIAWVYSDIRDYNTAIGYEPNTRTSFTSGRISSIAALTLSCSTCPSKSMKKT